MKQEDKSGERGDFGSKEKVVFEVSLRMACVPSRHREEDSTRRSRTPSRDPISNHFELR